MDKNTPTDLKVVSRLKEVEKEAEFNKERIIGLRSDLKNDLVLLRTELKSDLSLLRGDIKDLSDWLKEHDQRHRSIDGRLALLGFGTPIATGVIVYLVTTFGGG